MMKFNLNISLPGENYSNKDRTGYDRDSILEHISKMNLDEITLNCLINDLNRCPVGALSSFISTLNNRIIEIRRKK